MEGLLREVHVLFREYEAKFVTDDVRCDPQIQKRIQKDAEVKYRFFQEIVKPDVSKMTFIMNLCFVGDMVWKMTIVLTLDFVGEIVWKETFEFELNHDTTEVCVFICTTVLSSAKTYIFQMSARISQPAPVQLIVVLRICSFCQSESSTAHFEYSRARISMESRIKVKTHKTKKIERSLKRFGLYCQYPRLCIVMMLHVSSY